MNIKNLLKEDFDYFKNNFLDLCLIALIGVLISNFTNNIENLKILPWLLRIVFLFVIMPTIDSLIELEIYYSKIWKRHFNLNEMINRLDRNIIQLSIYRTIRIYLWTLLFIVPGIIKYLDYSRSIIIYDKHKTLSFNDIFLESTEQMKNFKKNLFINTLIMILITSIISLIFRSLSVSLIYYIIVAASSVLTLIVNPIYQTKVDLYKYK